MLAAWADLRLAESVAGLPVEVKVEPGAVTVRNATGVTVPSFRAEPDPVSLAQVSGRVRSSIRGGRLPRGPQHRASWAARRRSSCAWRRLFACVEPCASPASASRSRAASTESAGPSSGCRSRGKARGRGSGAARRHRAPAPRQGPARPARADDRARAHVRAEAAVRPVPLQPRPDWAELGDVRVPDGCAEARAEPAAASGDEDFTVGWIVLGPRACGGASRGRGRLGALLAALRPNGARRRAAPGILRVCGCPASGSARSRGRRGVRSDAS